MSENIDKETILKLIKISKLSLNESKLEKIIKDMGNIINFANQINDFEDSKEVYITNKIKGHTREDVCKKSINQSDVLSGAIESQDGFYVIKNSQQ